MGALAGRKALVKVTGAPLAFTAEATTANGAFTVYTITNAAKSVWDPTAAITVLVGGVAVAASLYTLNRLIGTITFLVARAPTDVVTVTGTYLPLTTAAGCKSWSYTESATLDDASEFGDTYKNNLRGLLDIAGTLGLWWQTGGDYFRPALIADTPVVVELFGDASAAFERRVWATLDKVQMQAAVAGNIDESVDFQGYADADGTVAAAN